MSKLGLAALKALTATTIKSNGAKLITGPKDQAIRFSDYDSFLNLVDGGMVVDAISGYTTEIAISDSDRRVFPHLGKVLDLIDAIPVSGGTVSSVSVVTANGFSGSVATSTTTPAITLSITDAAVTSKILTGYVSGAGTVSDSDTVLQAIQKLNGNIAALPASVTSVSGTTNRITSTGGATPTIDISASYVGQSSITTLGTIGTGVWQGTAIADTYIASAATWNAKQGTITLTTTGTSGAATLIGNTLNIPQYTGGGGSGTVTTVSVVTANGVSGSVATATTTPAITITLGAITPTSVVASGAISGTNFAESSTSLRVGTGSLFHASNTKGTIVGLGGSAALGINATVLGYGNRAGQYGVTIGTDNFTSTTAPNGLLLIANSATNTKSSGQNGVILIPNSYTAANGFGIVAIGDSINVTSASPTSTSLNSGIYLGEGVTHTGASTTAGIIIGKGNNGRDGVRPVLIGMGIVTANGLQNTVVIGYNASSLDAQTNNVVIGQNSKAYLDSTYGTGGSGLIAIGESAFSGAWKAVAVGAYARALAVSSVAIGHAAIALTPHSFALGRGCYNDVQNSVAFYSSTATTIHKFYFGGVAAKWTNPSFAETINYSTANNAGTTVSKLYGISGRDAELTPALTDVRGGHIRIVGGLSTGTAKGGNVELAVALAGGASNNTENSEVVLFRSSADSNANISYQDLIIDNAAKGLVLKATTGGHYFRFQCDSTGLLIQPGTDLGTTI